MKKILLIPLDERPCNYDFPRMLARGTDCQLAMPPREILGQKKIAGDTEAIWQWLTENVARCDSAVVSIDTLLYSGIVPSRLHHFTAEQLLERLQKLRELKKINPRLTLYAFSLIMRNPTYSSSEEEPDYYAQCGREIYLCGAIRHKRELGLASAEELEQLQEMERTIPQEALQDYLKRREINLEVNKEVIRLTAQGVLDFTVIPQDDSSPYGLTAKDQQVVRTLIDDQQVNLKVYMYPDADAVGNVLLARTINRLTGKRPMVFVKYASSAGPTVIPSYEDRIVSESIKYQILAAGGLVASSASEADLILLVNIPGGEMQDTLQEPKNGMIYQHTLPYDAFRNLPELIEYAGYAIEVLHKQVVFADIAYGNGGDPLLFSMLKQSGLLWKLAGYAGWNTSSNTLGTCIPMGMLHAIYGDTQGSRDFLAVRYLEDIGYDAVVRREVYDKGLAAPGPDTEHTDGRRGKTAATIHQLLQKFAQENLNDASHKVTVTDCWLPWNRLFEAGISAMVESKEL
jgi:hypothetical protein